MSEMAAKFSGTCQTCKGGIAVGDRIIWSRDEGARHIPGGCGTATPRPPAPEGFKALNAMFAGVCRNCHAPITQGESILYQTGTGAFHDGCPTVVTAPEGERFGGAPVPIVVPNGRYTITLTDPDVRVYLRLKAFHGEQAVQFMPSGDEKQEFENGWGGRWYAFGTVRGKEVAVWRREVERLPARVRVAVDVLLNGDDWARYGEAYALEFGRCFRCDKELRVPASLCRGVGPECAKTLGIEVSKEEIAEWVEAHSVLA